MGLDENIYCMPASPTEFRYRYTVSAETESIGISIGAEIFFTETEILFIFIFSIIKEPLKPNLLPNFQDF